MFVIKKTEDIIIEWPVRVEVPVSGGGVAKHEFVGLFPRIAESDLQRLIDESKQEAVGDERPNADAIHTFGRLLKGWKRVQDEAGNPVDYSPETLAGLITGPEGTCVALALWRALGQVRTGAKAKN